MSDIQNFLKSALCDLTSPEGGRSLNLNVTVTETEKVRQLEKQIADLQKEIEEVTQKYKRAEYLYRCETLINTQLTDYIEDLGIEVPKRLFSVSL